MSSIYTSYSKPISIKLLKKMFPECKTTEELITFVTTIATVDFSKQKLTSIDGLDMLTELQIVNLSDNMIRDVPQMTIDLLTNLHTVNFYNNQLTSIPDLSRTNIQELNIAFNPISQFDIEKLPPTLRAISVSGIEAPTDALIQRGIELVVSPEPVKVTENEIEQNLHQDAVDYTIQKKLEEKGATFKTEVKKPAPKEPPKPLRVARKPLTKPPKILEKPKEESSNENNVVVEQKAQTAAHINLIDNVTQELNERYSQALNEIDALKFDLFNNRIESIIDESRKRVSNLGWEGVAEERLDDVRLKEIEHELDEELDEDD